MHGLASLEILPLTGRPAGFVVGLAAEARLLRGCGVVGIGGGMPDGAQAAAERLVAAGVGALVSFGLAGGLDPARHPGDVIVPRRVWEDGAQFEADPALIALLGGPTVDLLAATAAPVASAADKVALFRATGAAAVDLESGAVARVAGRHGLPFAVLRVVCDPAWRDLPPAALAALDAGGAIAARRILASLLRHPMQLPALLRLAADAGAARSALRAATSRLRGGG